MKRYFLVLCLLLLLPVLCSCGEEEIRTIKIYNCVDYIDEAVLDDFVDYFYEKHGERIDYIYDTFETNESMYNTIRTGKTDYDLCCPSDYMIQKMIREDRVEKFDFEQYNLDTYFENCSPYLLDLFEQNGWTEYAACYMWGTLGLIYNPSELASKVDEEDYTVESWEDFLKPEFKGMASLKDSVRDAYCVASIMVHKDELSKVDSSSKEYNTLIQDVINRVSDEDIEKVSNKLREIKSNIYGLEVDSAKGDIVTGKIAMNLAWSGDAVYSIDLAEEAGIELRYTVPNEGGNVWFDGWVMPKGADKELAQEFINFLSLPEIAAQNMEEIGYTSSIAGDAIYNLIDEWYGVASNELYVEECQALYDEDPTIENKELLDEAIAYLDEATYTEVDLTYFFKGTLSEEYLTDDKVIVTIDDSYMGRQFTTQYPDLDTLNRCGVMQDFDEQNETVLQMWINVKANKASVILIVSLISFVTLAILLVLYSKRSYFARKRRLNKK